MWPWPRGRTFETRNRSKAGAEPVLDWLKSLPATERKEIGRNLMRPHRARVLFCVHRHELIALHGFIKKTQKTAPADLDLAKKRMKEVTKS